MVIQDDIIERVVVPRCEPMKLPKASVAATGFPQPPPHTPTIRTEPAAPTSPTLRISTRDLAKLAWTNPVEEHEQDSNEPRYDFEGNVILVDPEYSSELYHHGNEPGKPGYTLEELFHLSHSGFGAQKILAVRTIGNIACTHKDIPLRREMHAALVGTWRAHVRLSVACSDVSVGVKAESWRALLSLIENLDKECGCVVEDLSEIVEFFRVVDLDNPDSVKVFAYIVNGRRKGGEEVEGYEELIEMFSATLAEACNRLGLDMHAYQCGVGDAKNMVSSLGSAAPPAEVIATIADRMACIFEEPLLDSDIVLFERLLAGCRPSIPFFVEGAGDSFAWSARANLVSQAFMGGMSASQAQMEFLAKLVCLFTSSLFPVECRVGIWTNLEILLNISRVMAGKSLMLLGNHGLVDFACADMHATRENASVVRGIKCGCKEFLEEVSETPIDDRCEELDTWAEQIVAQLASF